MPAEHSDQGAFAHRLPEARLVDRISYLCGQVSGRRAIHVGFADTGCRELHRSRERWVHESLAREAGQLVGIDLDDRGVAEARAHGYEAYAVDCTDVQEVARLGLEAAETVVAGEIIEHVDDAGGFLEGLRLLCRHDGVLVVTTPNASGWLNSMAALGGYEVNHPDHVAAYTWYTLSNLLRRHGWLPVSAATFVPAVGGVPIGGGVRLRVMTSAARAAVGLERFVARRLAPFVADGLIVVARPT